MNPVYELNGLEQVYGDVLALKLESYSIASGRTTALVGPNGSGKSSMLDLLAFIHPPVKGRIRFLGKAADPNNYPHLRRQIAYLQQKPYLFNTTVEKNIELGLKLRGVPKQARDQRTEEIIEEFGFSLLKERRAHELSGGEIQKIAIARAMVLQSPVLLMDEPFSHLDRVFRNKLEQLLRDTTQQGDQTVIFSTHDQLQAQRLADSVCSLIDGHVVQTLVINLFSGAIDKYRNIFDTGKIQIHIPPGYRAGNRLAIDCTHLVLSRHELESSMRNSFYGCIRSMTEEAGQIHVSVDAGELFHAIITPDALTELAVNVGESIWVSFKSTAVSIL
ncbi:MAG: ABC transporter ATP-binding protein [Gammaproteobacteria bacterium]